MKLKTLLAALVAATALTGVAHAATGVEWSGNVAITSDYVFRGITQTDSEPAVQGGFDMTSGDFYAGVWGSTVHYNHDGASTEFDFYTGWTPEAWGFDWDLGVIYYWYPSNDGADSDADLSFFEVHGGASRDFGPVTAGLHVFYSPEFKGETGDAWYTELGLSGDVNDWLSLSGGIGYQDIEELTSYTTWNAGATFHVQGFDVDVRYHDTDDHDDVDRARGSLTVSRPLN